jgi:hypothetical protein
MAKLAFFRRSSLLALAGSVALASLLVSSLAAGQAIRPATAATSPPTPPASSPTEAPSSPAPTSPPPASEPATPGGTGDDISTQLKEAQERYGRALKLYDDGAFDAALLEFQRAYELAPTFRILYNLGVVSLELHDYANALAYFERYLADGKSSVPPGIRTEVEGRLRDLAGRLALVTVTVNVRGAEISVDDRVVGTAPLTAALRLNAGSRRISVRAAGYIPDSRIVDVAGGDSKRVALVLVNPAADVRVGPAAERPTRPIPWLGWTSAAVLGGTASVFGIEALNAERSFEHQRNQLGVSRHELDHAQAKTLYLSLKADVLAASALAVGGYSLYVTLRPPKQEHAAEHLGRIELHVLFTPTGTAVRGRF